MVPTLFLMLFRWVLAPSSPVANLRLSCHVENPLNNECTGRSKQRAHIWSTGCRRERPPKSAVPCSYEITYNTPVHCLTVGYECCSYQLQDRELVERGNRRLGTDSRIPDVLNPSFDIIFRYLPVCKDRRSNSTPRSWQATVNWIGFYYDSSILRNWTMRMKDGKSLDGMALGRWSRWDIERQRLPNHCAVANTKRGIHIRRCLKV
jgi:hypothetical protein